MQSQQGIEIPYFAVGLEPNRWLWISPVSLPDGDQFARGVQKDWWGFEILSGYPHLKAGLVDQFIPQMLNLQLQDVDTPIGSNWIINNHIGYRVRLLYAPLETKKCEVETYDYICKISVQFVLLVLEVCALIIFIHQTKSLNPHA